MALAVGWAVGTVVSIAIPTSSSFTGAVFQTLLLGGLASGAFVAAAHFLAIPEILVWRTRILGRFGAGGSDAGS
ncbi:MAG: hypothetical protein IPJ77_07265 [Planctomycetes bacterium]|nr:hypothetical protein [Planctomycetota bacterium]